MVVVSSYFVMLGLVHIRAKRVSLYYKLVNFNQCTYKRQQKKFLRKLALSQILMKFMVVAIPRVTTGKSNSSNYENKSKPVNLALTDCILQFEYIK